MASRSILDADPPVTSAPSPRSSIIPGLALSLTVALLAVLVGRIHPVISPLLVAILLGSGLAAAGRIPEAARPGLDVAGRRLLRLGIILLGLHLSLHDVAGLGLGVILVVIGVVVAGIAMTHWLGARLGIGWSQRMLIACGFSICGAAAIAATRESIDADEDEVATSIALVVIFGTVMVAVIPLGAMLLELSEEVAGVWAGASVHEVAQVVATGGALGGGTALSIAIVVKLARVLMLAPVIAWVSWRMRVRASRSAQPTGTSTAPPVVPPFVLGFLACVALSTWAPLPEPVVIVAAQAQTVLLAAAMGALGCGVRLAQLRQAGRGPVILAGLSTVWVAALGLLGALLVTLS